MQSPANFKPDQVASRTKALGGNNWRRGYGPQGPVRWGTATVATAIWGPDLDKQSDQGQLLGESLSICV